jgi:hypothetical protein
MAERAPRFQQRDFTAPSILKIERSRLREDREDNGLSAGEGEVIGSASPVRTTIHAIIGMAMGASGRGKPARNRGQGEKGFAHDRLPSPVTVAQLT